jgi:hypothetical protein
MDILFSRIRQNKETMYYIYLATTKPYVPELLHQDKEKDMKMTILWIPRDRSYLFYFFPRRMKDAYNSR